MVNEPALGHGVTSLDPAESPNATARQEVEKISFALEMGNNVLPPFRLQGSYRNMNQLAERIVPVMNDEEFEGVIDDHYLGEAQTLTTGAEANLLKLAELRGRLAPEQAAGWTEVKAAYLRERALGGAEDDPMTRAVGAVGLLADRVAGVEEAIGRLRGAPPPAG
jgi:hypothetical protein